MTLVQEFAESVEHGLVTLACVNTADGWKLSRHCAKYPIIFHALLHVAACDLQIQGCSGGRLGHGARALECVPGVDETLIVYWHAGSFVDWKGQQALGTVRCTTEDLFGDSWKDIVFV